MREFTLLAIVLGALIGVVFGAANAYIGLKVGMTVSASIPAAVISMALLRGILRRGTLRENNIVQTVGSVGESLAAGMIFVIPALLILSVKAGDPDLAPKWLEMTLWGAFGGVLGVLFMIPLRRLLIVKEHGKLPYPEGTACAEVLASGDRGGSAARCVFWGLGIGAAFELVRGLGFFAEQARQKIPTLRTELSLDTSPALLGVGYILGARIAGYLLGGAVLGWFVIIPGIRFFGSLGDGPIPPGKVPVEAMSSQDIWNNYLRYVGAGAVVLGGLVALFRSLGTIGSSLFHLFTTTGRTGERTDRDTPIWILLPLFLLVGAALWVLPDYGQLNALFKHIPVIACVIGFGFFFVTVSARLTGIVGGSSNPASGMTIATMLGTALVITTLGTQMGMDPVAQKVAIISVGALVCIAICIGGDTAQDLKTGYLVQATPWKQQVAELIGVLLAAGALAGILVLINNTTGFVATPDTPNPMPAYQANIMAIVVDGVVDGDLPWGLVLMGIAAALVVEFLGVRSLPFAVGLYLPLYLSTPIMVGGLVRWFVDRQRQPAGEIDNPGILAASGLVAGHGVMGVGLVAAAAVIGWIAPHARYQPQEYDEARQGWVTPAAEAVAESAVERITPLPPDGATLDEDDPVWPPDPDAPEIETPADADVPAEGVQADSSGDGAAPGSEPATQPGEPVVPHHLFDWLTRKTPIPPEYGLRPYRQNVGPFRGAYALDWYQLLPLVPFGLLTLWLLFIALRRNPIERVLEPPPESGGNAPDGAGPDGFAAPDVTRERDVHPPSPS